MHGCSAKKQQQQSLPKPSGKRFHSCEMPQQLPNQNRNTNNNNNNTTPPEALSQKAEFVQHFMLHNHAITHIHKLTSLGLVVFCFSLCPLPSCQCCGNLIAKVSKVSLADVLHWQRAGSAPALLARPALHSYH